LIARKIWSRAWQMSADEIRTRARQELSKRLDVLAYGSGLKRPPRQLPSRAVPPGKFFFSSSDLPERISLLRTHLPLAVEDIRTEADAICRHQFNLLGYESVDYGPRIDWHLDAVHGNKAPLVPWFKIAFLDFSIVGDHKITWELNRHQHLVTLAKAWCLTRDQHYATELRAQWYDWQTANPYPLGINWGSALEVAFRSVSWLWVQNLLAGSPALDAGFDRDLRLALQLHGRHIERYLSTYFSPNTHLLGEAVALLFIGCLVPELASAARWRALGWQIVLHEAQRQVRPDGVYFEQALYYHVYALDFFLHARVLAQLNGIEIPQDFDRVLQSMLDVLLALSQAGPPQPFGDDDGGRLFNPRRNRPEHLTDPLAIGALVYGRADLAAITGLTEEAVWLFGKPTLAALSASSPRSAPRSQAFLHGGLYIMTDGDASAQQLVIDAGPQGTARSGHGHADALSLRYSFNRRPWLVDPGTYCYISADRERNHWNGTGAHNTLRVDGLDQAAPLGPFAWTSLPHVKAERWISGETFDLFVGSHDGYSRLPHPVIHQRLVFRLRGGLSLIRDLALGTHIHTLETFWHFAPDLKVHEEGRALIAAPSAPNADGLHAETRLALLASHGSAWLRNVGSGLVSSAYGAKETAPVACFSSTVQLPAECAFLLAPLLGGAPPGTFETLDENHNRLARAYLYETPDAAHYMFCADAAGTWTLGPWTSDARFLYCGLEDRRLVHLILVAGSFAKWHDQPIVTHRQEVQRFEWLHTADTVRSSSSDQNALDYLLRSDLECADSVGCRLQINIE
jgi:hypothetical protein